MVEETEEPPPKLETAADILFEKYRPEAPEIDKKADIGTISRESTANEHVLPTIDEELAMQASISELVEDSDSSKKTKPKMDFFEELMNDSPSLNLSRYHEDSTDPAYATYNYQSAGVHPEDTIAGVYETSTPTVDSENSYYADNDSSEEVDDGKDRFVGRIIDFGPAYDPITNRIRQVRKSMNPNELFKHYKLIDDLAIRMPLSY